MKLKNYNLVTILGFITLILLVMSMGIFAGVSLNWMNNTFEQAHQVHHEAYLAWSEAEHISMTLDTICSSTQRLIVFNTEMLNNNPALIRGIYDSISDVDQEIKQYLDTIKLHQDNRLEVQNFRQAYTNWSEVKAQLDEAIGRGEQELFLTLLKTTGCTKIAEVKNAMGLLVERYQDNAEHIILDLNNSYQKTSQRITVLFVVAVLLATVVAYVVGKKLLKMDKTLRQSEAHYRMLFNSMQNGYALHQIIWDEHGNPCDYVFLDVNPAFEKLTGLSREQCIGKSVRSILPQTEQYWIDTYGRIFLADEPVYAINFSQALDKYFEVYAYRTAKDQFAVVFQDITQREIANQALIKSEKRLKQAQAIAQVGYWELDLSNDQVWCSDEFYKIYGLERQAGYIELARIKKMMHSEDRERIDQELKALIEKDSKYDVVYRIRAENDGSEKYIHSMAVVERQENKAVRISGFIQDITTSKRFELSLYENEVKNQAIMSNISDVVTIVNLEGKVIYASPNLKRIFGWEVKEHLNEDAYKFIHPQDLEMVKNVLQELYEEGPYATRKYEFRYLCKDGQYRYIENNAINLVEHSNIQGFLITYSDISLRKKREAEIVYLGEHDVLTGLNNRAYFEAQCRIIDREDQLPLSLIIADLNGLKMVNDMLGHLEGDSRLIKAARLFAQFTRESDIVARIGGDEFCLLLPKTDEKEAEEICKKITQACKQLELDEGNEWNVLSISLGYATKVKPSQSIESIQRKAEEKMYRHKLLERKSIYSSSIASIKTTLYEKSHETEAHAERLVQLSLAIGKELNLTQSDLDNLALAAALHDIGKMGIDNSILLKADRLDEQEWHSIKQHPEIGYRIAMSIGELKHIAEYILCHHERWDGKGYPQGLSEEEIPLLSRIIAVVDAYDAMTQDRAYRKALSKERALQEIIANKRAQFDPQIVDIFVRKVLKAN